MVMNQNSANINIPIEIPLLCRKKARKPAIAAMHDPHSLVRFGD